MAEQDPLEYSSQRFEKIKKEALDAIRGTGDLEEGWKKAQDAAEEYYVQMKQQKALAKQLGKEYEQVFKKAEKRADAFTKPFEKFADLLQTFPIDQLFDSNKIDSAISTFKGSVMSTFEGAGGGLGGSLTSGLKQGMSVSKDLMGSVATLGKNIVASLSAMKVFLGVGGILVLGAFKIFEAFQAVDKAAADLVKTTGILDDRLSNVLLTATENAGILGGNVQLAADAAKEIVSQFSVSVPLSGRLVGNVARLSEQFGLGNESATKLVRIISERMSGSLGVASEMAGSFIDSLGRIGPAVVRNIVDNYEAVNNSFGLSVKQLKSQGFLATQLGVSLGDVAETARGLLNLSSSITSEFKASALLGETLNLQRARQLAFEGDIVGANQEILDQVEKLGDLSKFNTFQREALADATGKTVSELQRELNIRRRIGDLGRIQARQRETVLGRFEEIGRRISAAFFRVFASEEMQKAIENLADGVISLLKSDKLGNFTDALGSFIDTIGRWMGGEVRLERNWMGIPTEFVDVKQMNDGIITNRGEVVSTNPKDYIIATQTPGDLVSGGSSNKEVMNEVRSLLKHLKDKGVKAGDTYLDGRKVSMQVANSMR